MHAAALLALSPHPTSRARRASQPGTAPAGSPARPVHRPSVARGMSGHPRYPTRSGPGMARLSWAGLAAPGRCPAYERPQSVRAPAGHSGQVPLPRRAAGSARPPGPHHPLPLPLCPPVARAPRCTPSGDSYVGLGGPPTSPCGQRHHPASHGIRCTCTCGNHVAASRQPRRIREAGPLPCWRRALLLRLRVGQDCSLPPPAARRARTCASCGCADARGFPRWGTGVCAARLTPPASWWPGPAFHGCPSAGARPQTAPGPGRACGGG